MRLPTPRQDDRGSIFTDPNRTRHSARIPQIAVNDLADSPSGTGAQGIGSQLRSTHRQSAQEQRSAGSSEGAERTGDGVGSVSRETTELNRRIGFIGDAFEATNRPAGYEVQLQPQQATGRISARTLTSSLRLPPSGGPSFAVSSTIDQSRCPTSHADPVARASRPSRDPESPSCLPASPLHGRPQRARCSDHSIG